MSEVTPDADEVRRWLAFARDDLAYGESGMADHPRPASWSFLQAGEKALKAVLLAKGLDYPRSHDLAFLLTTLSASVLNTDLIREAVLTLATVSPATRYPDDGLEFNARNTVALAKAAREILEWAEAHCRL